MDKQTTDQAKLIFADVFNIKTETTFKTDGSLVVVPIDWKEGEAILETPSKRNPPKVYGKMEYSLSGKAIFVPSKRTNTTRYQTIHEDDFLVIKETNNDLIFKVQAAKGYFKDNKTVKPVMDTFDWAKQFIKNDIKTRQNHKKKRLIPTTHPTTQG
jgi:hypothetical protein